MINWFTDWSHKSLLQNVVSSRACIQKTKFDVKEMAVHCKVIYCLSHDVVTIACRLWCLTTFFDPSVHCRMKTMKTCSKQSKHYILHPKGPHQETNITVFNQK